MAAVIVVREGGGNAAARTSHACFRCHVAESSVAVVMKKMVGACGQGDVKVRSAVAVIIAHRNRRREIRNQSLPGTVRQIGEGRAGRPRASRKINSQL